MFGHQRGDSREGIGKREREGRHPGDTQETPSPWLPPAQLQHKILYFNIIFMHVDFENVRAQALKYSKIHLRVHIVAQFGPLEPAKGLPGTHHGWVPQKVTFFAWVVLNGSTVGTKITNNSKSPPLEDIHQKWHPKCIDSEYTWAMNPPKASHWEACVFFTFSFHFWGPGRNVRCSQTRAEIPKWSEGGTHRINSKLGQIKIESKSYFLCLYMCCMCVSTCSHSLYIYMCWFLGVYIIHTYKLYIIYLYIEMSVVLMC